MMVDFAKKDLENIDFDKIENFNVALANEDIIKKGFTFSLKDGRVFDCKVNNKNKFNLHSEKHGDFKVNLAQKLAADIVNDNDEFFIIMKTIKDVANFIDDYAYGSVESSDFDTVMNYECAEILERRFTSDELIMKYVEMGLDKTNKFVTIEPVLTEEKIDFDRTIHKIGDDLDKTCWLKGFKLYLKDNNEKYRHLFVRVDDKPENYTLHSETYGDFKVNFIAKFTAEVLGNNDKVYELLQQTKDIMNNLIENGAKVDISEEDLVNIQLLKILSKKFTNNEIITKIVEYGLKNDGVRFSAHSLNEWGE